MLSEEEASGTFGIRSPSFSNKTAEPRGLNCFGKKVMGFRGLKGVLSMAAKANEESDGPLKKSLISVSSSL